MRYRTLGATDLRVSEIGFGAWGIGGSADGAVAYGPADDRISARAVASALEHGVNFFDTADFYGFGHSETVLGRALAGMRDRVVIASKAGMRSASGGQDFTPQYLSRSLDGSLARLGTSYLDLYLLHSPPVDLLACDDRCVAALENFRREGRIRHYGISARSPDDALIAVRELGFRCVQVNFNLVDQRARENGLFALCQREQVGVIIRTPLSFGFLTGRVPGETRFEPDDHRSRWSPEQRQRWASAPALFRPEGATLAAQTAAQFALRFCLSFAAVSTVIPGMLTEDHVRENTAASELGALSDPDREHVLQVYRKTPFLVER